VTQNLKKFPSFQREVPKSNWLGPLDEIPDMGFPSFLKLIHDKLSLDYQVTQPPSVVRVFFKGSQTNDPGALWQFVVASHQGTLIESEKIVSLLGKLQITQQNFRDAFNSFFKLTPPSEEPPKEE
jgi:hypothetical protein